MPLSRQGGVVNRREQRIVSPTGQGALNMSRSLGDPAYKQPHRLVSCEPTVKSIELTCAAGFLRVCQLFRDNEMRMSHADDGNLLMSAAELGSRSCSCHDQQRGSACTRIQAVLNVTGGAARSLHKRIAAHNLCCCRAGAMTGR